MDGGKSHIKHLASKKATTLLSVCHNLNAYLPKDIYSQGIKYQKGLMEDDEVDDRQKLSVG